MNWALIGLGYISQRHRDAIEATGGKVLLTCDPVLPSDAADIEELCQHPQWKKVESVAICSPNYTHSAIIKECVKDGKRVLCEKPLCLSVEETRLLPDSVNAVLQLRYLNLQSFKDAVKKDPQAQIYLRVNVYRDRKYWLSWKGDEEKSGGILFNLGIHYFDLLLGLFGECEKIERWWVDEDEARIGLTFEKHKVEVHLWIHDMKNMNMRSLFVGYKEFLLSNKENLSEEDLHIKVYRDFINNNGVKPAEAARSIHLVERILKTK